MKLTNRLKELETKSLPVQPIAIEIDTELDGESGVTSCYSDGYPKSILISVIDCRKGGADEIN